MADNAFVKIGTTLLKHQVKKLVGEEALGAISEELAGIGRDKLNAYDVPLYITRWRMRRRNDFLHSCRGKVVPAVRKRRGFLKI